MKRKKAKVVILGAGGFGEDVYWYLSDIDKVKQEIDVLGFIDEDPVKQGSCLAGLPVLGGLEWFETIDMSSVKVVCGVTSGRTKMALAEKIARLGLEFATIIHPSVWMGPLAEIGYGTVVGAGCMLSTQAKVGRYVSIVTDSVIGHDAVVGDFSSVFMDCHIGGHAILEEGVSIGTAATVLNEVRIGKWSIVGAGAVVTKNLPEYVTAVGVPAKVIKHRDNG